MTFAHRKSQISYAVTAVIGLTILLLLIIGRPFESEGANFLSAFLMIPFTILASNGFASVIEQRENDRDLDILYVDFDPERFLETYEPIAENMKSSSFVEASIQLAEGLMASGDGIVARKLLDNLRNRALDAHMIVKLDTLALRCSLLGEDRGKALHDAHKIQDFLRSVSGIPELYRNHYLEKARPYMEIVEEKEGLPALHELFNTTPMQLQKLEAAYLLSIYSDDGEAREYYEKNRKKVSY